MRAYHKKIWTLASAVLITLFFLSEAIHAYNTQTVYDYAWEWATEINPSFANYLDDPLLHEDANFVSQALIAGGMLSSANFVPFSGVDNYGCLTTRGALAEFLKDYEHANPMGFKVDYFVPSSLAYGDVVFFGDESNPYQRVGIVVGYNPVLDDFDIAYHNNQLATDAIIGGISSLKGLMLFWGNATFYHIPKPPETLYDQRFYGGRGFMDPMP